MAKRERPDAGTMGERILEIRQALAMDTEEFAAALNRVAASLDHEQTWSASKVSRATNNAHRMKLDEAIDIVTAAKPTRTLDWLVFGGKALATVPAPKHKPGELIQPTRKPKPPQRAAG